MTLISPLLFLALAIAWPRMAADVAERGVLASPVSFFTIFFFVVTNPLNVLHCPVVPATEIHSIGECATVPKENKYAIKIFKNFWVSKPPPLPYKAGQPSPSSALLDAGVSVVVVDAFVVLRFHLVPGHIGMGVQLERHVAHQVLHEHRVLVSPFCHRLLILPLHQPIHYRARRTFHQRDQILNPHRPPRPDFYGHC